MTARSTNEVGGLPATIVEAWIEAERPNPVVFFVLAGASVFLAAPFLVAYQSAADLLPGAHDALASPLEVLASADARALLSDAPIALGGGLASLVAVGLAGRWIARWARDRFGTPPIVRVLRDRPGSMVWAYATKVRHVSANGTSETVTRHSHTVSIGLEDGSMFHDLPARDHEVEVALGALRALSPRLVVGFSDELRARFRRSPRTFAPAAAPRAPVRV